MGIEKLSSPLIRKIEDKLSRICVVGLGQVGLPTAVSFLELGYRVLGYDINQKLIRDLEAGVSPIPEKGFGELIKKFMQNGVFTVSTSAEVISTADVVIICVATPLDTDSHTADMSILSKSLEDLATYMTNDKLIVIESTIPPRTMKEFVIPKLEELSGKKAGIHFLISFCPERIAPGNSLYEFSNNARIIGADDDASYLASLSLFRNLTKGGLHRADTTTAEIAKLAENTFRDINIALANELAIICEEADVDVMDVIRIANTHPRVNVHKPGPGVGGPCLPKDPYLLIMNHRFEQSIVKIARSINDSMPTHVVKIATRAIESKFNVRTKESLNLAVLGVSYKPDVNDTRYSPTEGIVKGLLAEGFGNLSVHDPYSERSFGAKYTSDLGSILHNADCVIIATGHSVYSSLKAQDFRSNCIVMDAARILSSREFVDTGITYIALGAREKPSVHY